MSDIITHDAEATHKLGYLLGQRAQAGDVIVCAGALGAGKTTLIQGFAAGLDVDEGQYVRSPTFTLMQIYRGRHPLYHFDFYRLAHADEVWDIGFEDCLETGGVVVMEWGDKFPSVLPASRMEIRFEIISADQRRIAWTSTDDSHHHYHEIDPVTAAR
ncbi:MAG: ATP-binding protein [Candidatus Entotheonella factor]|uniref:tRNA threonylcarbamoyladenosine biosynthesis protein TsaE n=1 Tax=Entotheonella factor TaxID=1429438 RepID=W4LQX8_ENTF1|nr:tRNA (adenosine(37)-N6)-threonylcarbamoyltransferase complex ATPase subunit type 1 TsaE [Candidatus Entotheonella palauensis]ETX00151.1 MAG: ATP-binding protein [Candidatus Entotheonella factor]